MRSVIRKIGSSQGLIIPKPYLDSLGLSEGSQVKMEVHGKEIIVKAERRKPSLEELVSKMTPENAHEEICFGPLLGEEMVVYAAEEGLREKK